MIITTDKVMRPRDPDDFYPTPAALIQTALQRVGELFGIDDRPDTILDPGAGDGAWGKVARNVWPRAHIQGVELRTVAAPDAYDGWRTEDFRLFDPPREYDLVMGNPPYKFAEAFVPKVLEREGEALDALPEYRGIPRLVP